MRRRSGHWCVQYGAMAAYYLPNLVVLYTANAVYSSDSDIKVFLGNGCLVLLVVSARGTASMTAFTLGNGPLKLESWRVLPWLLYFGWLQWDLIWLDRKLTFSDLYYFIALFVAPLLYVVLVKPRASTSDFETKEFADQMMIESRLSPSPFFVDDAGHLYDRCRYPFNLKQRVESDHRWLHFSDVLKWIGWQRVESDDRWINFSDVLKWRRLLTENSAAAVDPDICLAYSLCRLLARRYFGFPCPEDGNVQVRDFVLRELLAGSNNKAFAIVEVQLALLHDYFFTNYHSKMKSAVLTVTQGVVHMLCFPLGFIGSCVVVNLLTTRGLSSALVHEDLPYLGVFFVLGFLIYTVIMQPRHPVLPTYWHPIWNLFAHYIPADEIGNLFGSIVVTFSFTSSTPSSQSSGKTSSYYWRNKMGQYSVMDDYDRRSPKKYIIAWFKVHVLSQVSYSFIKHHPVGEEDVSVPDEVKKSVARTIQDMNGSPTMGTSLLLLRADGAQEDLSWTCRQDTLTHTILIWHVATCYCDMSKSQPQQPEAQSMEELSTIDSKVAMNLSKYCAYLVAFLPELLPEHSLTVKVVLQEVLKEAGQKKELLGGTHCSMEEKTRRIQQLDLPEDMSRMKTFEKGVLLGRQLEKQSVLLRWKTMADFWAETILYIASSSKNSAAHIQQLAQGGEFVTHVWALLCNAGIQSG
ncbi:hypothetical protein HU200_013470 [Digitaria exilis]|uniref:DUF4220 domain-containing protein n=1 Tax=Digitaria exilis TaxID=1010633 RepID=A0A835FD09_9POAL|nr:hypothetical protein HU200_013470 [Digitaria exilis]